jgi:hypothetical protein
MSVSIFRRKETKYSYRRGYGCNYRYSRSVAISMIVKFNMVGIGRF